MCSPSPPPPPDYRAAAQEQGAANAEAARIAGRMNNPNVNGPYGSQTVTWDGDTPTINQTLTPEQQAILNSHNATQLGMSGLAQQGITTAGGILGKPVDFGGAPSEAGAFNGASLPSTLNRNGLPPMAANSGAIRDRVIAAMLSRANPAIDRQAEQTNSDLIARGIRPGTEAYTREQDAINRQRNDAQQQAELAGEQAANTAFQQDMGIRQQAVGEQGQEFGQGMNVAGARQSQQAQTFGQSDALRRQFISELIARRQMPLNEVTALMSGSQVNNPFSMPGAAQNANVAPAPVFGATQAETGYNTDIHNANVSSRNATTGALTSAAMMAAMMF